jgi:hypothetical protein
MRCGTLLEVGYGKVLHWQYNTTLRQLLRHHPQAHDAGAAAWSGANCT